VISHTWTWTVLPALLHLLAWFQKSLRMEKHDHHMHILHRHIIKQTLQLQNSNSWLCDSSKYLQTFQLQTCQLSHIKQNAKLCSSESSKNLPLNYKQHNFCTDTVTHQFSNSIHCQKGHQPSTHKLISISAACSCLVVTRLPAVWERPGSNRDADKSCFHENHCDTQLWARAAHWLQCLGQLRLPPSEGR